VDRVGCRRHAGTRVVGDLAERCVYIQDASLHRLLPLDAWIWSTFLGDSVFSVRVVRTCDWYRRNRLLICTCIYSFVSLLILDLTSGAMDFIVSYFENIKIFPWEVISRKEGKIWKESSAIFYFYCAT